LYGFNKSHSYLTDIPPCVSLLNYEKWVDEGKIPEEFHWELYLHKGDTTGELYRVHQRSWGPNTFRLMKDTVHNIQSITPLVGLVRVVRVDVSWLDHLEKYLDWFTSLAADASPRSFVFATATFERVRDHLRRQDRGGDSSGSGSRAGGLVDHTVLPFMRDALTREMLTFAYRYLFFAARNIRPRPVIISQWGIEINLLDQQGKEESRQQAVRARAIMLHAEAARRSRQGPPTPPRWS
jgi:hypothetical protein